VTGGTERRQHGGYCPRRPPEAVLLLTLSTVFVPPMWEVATGVALILIELLTLLRLPLRRRLRHPADGVLVGLSLGWLAGRRRPRGGTT
jgi:hypothetical protein